MKKIYIILMHTRTIPARLIKFFTRYEYSHVGIALEKDCNVIYSFGRRNVYSILNGGFTAEYKEGEFFHKFNQTVCKIFETQITDEQFEKLNSIFTYMKSKENEYKYDYFGIIPRFFGIPIILKNRYVCSYFVASVLERTHICSFNKRVCFIKPEDFEHLKGFKEIYRGSFNLYSINKPVCTLERND